MKRLMIAGLLTPFVFVMGGATFAAAEDHPGRHLSTDGYGSLTATADWGEIFLNVSVVRREPIEAKNRVETLVNSLMARMEDLGLEPAALKASAIRIDAEYNVSRMDGSRELAGYRVTRPVMVTLDNLDLLDPVIKAAIEDSSVTISQVRYSASQADQYTEQAREMAVGDSYARAEFLASAYGACLGPPYRIVFRDGPSRPGPVMQEMARAATVSADAAYIPGQYTPGQVEFQARVEVVFDLELDCE